jgi:hypothetical protein
MPKSITCRMRMAASEGEKIWHISEFGIVPEPVPADVFPNSRPHCSRPDDAGKKNIWPSRRILDNVVGVRLKAYFRLGHNSGIELFEALFVFRAYFY